MDMVLARVAKDVKAFVSGKDLVVLAVGLALSTQLQATLNAVIQNLIMPFISFFTGPTNLVERAYILNDDEKHRTIKIGWGAALNALITFAITTVVMVEFARFVTTTLVQSSTIKWNA